jgi:hypothetical protein
MVAGLPVSRLINVEVELSPAAVPFANFDSLLIVGDSNVIGTGERIRAYGSLLEVADDFGIVAPEYTAAALFFGQTPQPASLFIGRWAQTATSGQLLCGVLTVAQQAMSLWTPITNGEFNVSIDGTPHLVVGCNFSATSNLNGVAAAIQAAVRTSGASTATVVWNGMQFVFSSGTTGVTSAVSYLTAGPANDIAVQLKGTSALAQSNTGGIVAESALQAVIILDGVRTFWYGLMFASIHIVDADHEAIAQYIEGSANPHVYGINTNNAQALSTTDNTSVGYVLNQAGYNRSFCLYSSTTPFATAAFFGRAFTVDFTGSNTAITMMWQQLAGVLPEYLGSTQANALDANDYNYVAEFNNNQAVLVNGKMAGTFYFDEIWGTDWLAGNIQTSLFSLLATVRTKIPQTDAGIHQLVNTCAASCAQGVTNGLIYKNGIWTAAGFGALNTGDPLPTGFYVYAPPVAVQAASDRAARKSPLLQIAVKLAGAVHTVNVLIDVTR